MVDVQAVSKFKDNYKYLLTAFEVFSKFLHIIPLKSQTGPAVSSAFQSNFKDPKYSTPLRRRPIWGRTDKGKDFLSKHIQNMLKRRTFSFRFVEIRTSNAPSLRSLSVQFGIGYTNTLPTKIRIDTLTFSHNLLRLTMTQFTPRLACRHQKSLIQRNLRYGRKQTTVVFVV